MIKSLKFIIRKFKFKIIVESGLQKSNWEKRNKEFYGPSHYKYKDVYDIKKIVNAG